MSLPPMPPIPATSFSLLSRSANMSNHVFMASNATVLGYLNVEKINYRYSNVTIYDSTNITSNLDVDGTLIVGGKTTLSDKLSVDGVVTLCNAVTVLGATSLSNNLFCTGSIAAQGNAAVAGTLTLGGVATLCNAVTVLGPLTLGNGTKNALYFAGTSADIGTPFSCILNRLYDPTGSSNVVADFSEMLIFQGNDPLTPFGPDRIRSIAGTHKWQVYNTSLLPVDTAANWQDNSYNTAMLINNVGYVGINKTNPSYNLDVTGDVRATGNIHSEGTFTGNGSVPIGVVMMWTTNSIPTGWVFCDGQSLSKTTYAGLFAVIGGTYGSSGTTFNVPNLCSRVVVGAGSTAGLTPRTLASTSGEETHTLSVAEMPQHTHNISTGYNGSHTHTASTNTSGSAHIHGAYTDYVGDHGHNLNLAVTTKDLGRADSAPWGEYYTTRNIYEKNGNSWGLYNGQRGDVGTSGGGGHSHNVTVAQNNSEHTHGVSVNAVGDHNHSASATETGSTNAHNVMQPYMVLQYIIRAM